jgi:hypothetical protein
LPWLTYAWAFCADGRGAGADGRTGRGARGAGAGFGSGRAGLEPNAAFWRAVLLGGCGRGLRFFEREERGGSLGGI